MNKLEDYTVVEILNMYKSIIGNEIEEFITKLFFIENSNMFRQMIDNKIKENNKKNNEKNRSRYAYEEIVQMLTANPKTNHDDEIKQTLIYEIYRRFSSKIPQKQLELIEKLLFEENLFVVYRYPSDKYTGIDECEIITREKQKKIKSIHNNNERQLMYDLVKSTVDSYQIGDVIKSEYGKSFYNIIIEQIYIKIFLDKKRMSVKDFNEKKANNELQEIVMQDEELNEEFFKELEEFFCNNLQFIDQESLMMNSAARIILGLKIFNGEDIEGIELDIKNENANEKESIEFLRLLYAEMKKQNYNDEYRIVSDEGEEIIRVDMKCLEEFLARCTRSRYLTQNEIENIHVEILKGHFSADLEVRKIAGINLEDLINANKSYELEEDEVKKEEKLKCNIELAEYLITEGIITEQELVDMFLQGEFNTELISNVNMKEITEEYYSNKLKTLYYEMVFSEEPEKVKEVIRRFSALYIELVEKNKLNIESDELIGEITTVLGDEFAPEILSDLYEFNIITLEKGIEWVGTNILFEEYKKGKLKSGEVRKLYENDIIDLPGIANVINRLSDNGEKFMVIGSIFPEETEDDKAIRELLFDECLKIEKGVKGDSSKSKGDVVDPNPTGDYYRHITDPFARIGLIKALDKDYSFEMTADGHAVVKLPNLKKVIIEKMLDKNREPAYGAATYILDDKYYNDNVFRIIKEHKINRQEILKDIDSKKVTRIIHSPEKWGNDIKDYFYNEANWDEEQEIIIDEAIRRVRRSDPIIKEKQKLVEKIMNLVVTRNASIDQIRQIAELYEVDLEKVMNLYDELFNER